MNEVLKVIAERNSCRGYESTPIEKEKVEAIALAAVQAPSAMNLQPWKLVVITDKSFIDEMDNEAMNVLKASDGQDAYDRMMSRGGKMFYNAPCMFVVLEKNNSELDSGIMVENISLAASSLGLGNVICGMAGMAFAGEKKEQFEKKIGIDEEYKLAMTVLVGYPTAPKAPHDPDLSKITYISG